MSDAPPPGGGSQVGGDPIDRARVWEAMSRLTPIPVQHRSEEVATLPAPAQRLLRRAVPVGSLAVAPIELELEGEIKLNRWFPFTARQILHPTGFVWNASVGWWWLRLRGGDGYWRGAGSLEFRLAGLLPVARAAGPDVARSAAGRLAVETAAWMPHCLLPDAGACWQPIDDTRATVVRAIDGVDHPVTVVVDGDGALRQVTTTRWGDPGGEAFGAHLFGGAIDDVDTFAGLTVATAGRVGWWWGTDRSDEGEFFRYRVRDIRALVSHP